MQFTTMTLGAAVAILSSTVSAGTLFVDNHCNVPLYLQSGSSTVAKGPVITLPAGRINAYHETLRGPSSKYNFVSVSRTPDMAHPVQAAYTQNTDGTTFYDLSTVFGDPLMAQGFELISSSPSPDVKCPPRTSGYCPHTYNPSNTNGNGALFQQPNADSFAFKLCASA